MAYSSLDQRDQTYHWNATPLYNDPNAFELKPKEPSISSAEPRFVGQAGPAHGDASSDYQHLLQPQSSPVVGSRWEPGFWRQLPAFGILSLIGVLASTLAALVILIKSHRQPLNAWGYGVAPSVYLAIASVIANASSAYALANGLEIAFWRNALKGRTLAELNQNWLNGQNLWHAVLQGYRVGGRITALACIFSVIALLRGPLNQRASEVKSDIAYDTSGAFNLSVAQVLPDNYTGIARHSRARIHEIARLTPGFAQVMQEHSMRTNITIEHKECGVSCSATVKGFGFKTQCRTQEYISEIATNGASTQTIFESSTDLYPITNISTNSYNYDNMGMRLNVTYRVNLTDADRASTPKDKMRTRLRSHICDLTGATVEYGVQVNSQTISRIRERFVKDLVMPGPGTNFHDSTIGGFEYVANYLFTSNAIFNFAGAVSSTSLTGALANEMVQGNTWGESFSDPMDSMIDTMQQIAFRTAVRAGKDIANSTDAKQQVQYHGSGRRSIYVTDFRYMAAAFAISIVSVFAVSLTFYGWWELGRIVSLSPLEIAKAFDAPLLANVGSNLDLSNNKNLGPTAAVVVRYGEKANEDVYTTGYSGATVDTQIHKLVIGAPGQVRRPNSKENYGT